MISVLWEEHYLALWDDGEISVSDGVGCVGTVDARETRKLYEALRKYYGDENKLNDSIEERNALLNSCNELADRINQLEEGLQND